MNKYKVIADFRFYKTDVALMSNKSAFEKQIKKEPDLGFLSRG